MTASNNKPNVNIAWAEDADSVDIVNPGDAKLEEGWNGGELPPHETFNFEQNRQSQFNKHINLEGIPVWDPDTPFIRDSITKDPTDRKIYTSTFGTEVTPNLNFQPSLNLDKWSKQIETDLEEVITPVNTSPADGVEVVDTTPDLISSAYRGLYSVAHGASEFRVARDEAMTDLIALSGVLGAVENWIVSPALDTGDDYFWDVRYQNTDGTWSQRSIPTGFNIPDAAVQTPTNLIPTDLDITVTDEVTLIANAFLSTPASVHEASQWHISTDATFAVIDFDSGEDAVNLTSFTQTGLTLNETTYYWRVRYKSDTLGWSAFSTTFSFTTVNETVQKPTNLTPTNGLTGVGASVQLTGDSFTSIPGGSQTHTASQWQVGNSDFSTIYFDSGTDAINLESITATGLVEGTLTHYWRVRYEGDVTGFSEWSTPFTFVTKAQFADWLNWVGAKGVDLLASSRSVNTSSSHTLMDVCKIGADKLLIAFQETSSFDLVAQVVTVSGLTCTKPASSESQQNSSDMQRLLVNEVDTDKALITGQYDNLSTIRGSIVTVVGDTPTANVDVNLTIDAARHAFQKHGVVKLDSSRTALCYIDTSYNVACVVVDTSGSIPSTGTATKYNYTNNLYGLSVCALDTDKIVLVCRDSITDQIYLQIVTFVGSTPTFAAPVVTSTILTSSAAFAITKTAPGEFTYFIHYNGNMESGKCTFTGTTPTVGTKTTSSGGTAAAHKFTAISPIDDQAMLLTGNGVNPISQNLTPHDPVIPTFKSPFAVTPVTRGANTGIAALDEERIAHVYQTASNNTQVRILDGS